MLKSCRRWVWGLLLCAPLWAAAATTAPPPLPGFRADLVRAMGNALRIEDGQVQSAQGGGAGGNVAGQLPKGFSAQLAGKVTVTSYQRTDERPHPVGELLRQFTQQWQPAGGRLLNNGYFDGEIGNYVFQFAGGGASPPEYRIVFLQDNFYTVTLVERDTDAATVSAEKISESIKKQGFATLHIQFPTARWSLDDAANQQIAQIVALLRRDPQLRLSVEGHTDQVGQRADNQTLSEQRARAVAEAVGRAGIAAERLRTRGFGADRPVADNATADGRAQNRRVELVKF